MTLQLYDLGQIVSITLASMSGVLAGFQLLRSLFLDRLTQAMPADQRDTLYRTLVWAILTVLITVLAMMNYYTLSVTLVVSAGVAAIPLTAGVHFVYTRLQKPTPPPSVVYAEIPPGQGSDVDSVA